VNYGLEEIFVERSAEGFLRIAIKDNGTLKECHIQEERGNAYPGEVYIGTSYKMCFYRYKLQEKCLYVYG